MLSGSVKGQLNSTYKRNAIETEIFCLYPNGTFKYVNSLHLQDITCEGTYKTNGDTIILNSFTQKEDLLQVKKWNIACADSIYLSLKMASGMSLNLITVYINDSEKIEINDTVTSVLKFAKIMSRNLDLGLLFYRNKRET